MFSEQLFDLILDLGDEWNVERVYANFKTEEIDIIIGYIGKEAEDPDTLEMCPIYDHTQIDAGVIWTPCSIRPT